MVEGNKRKKFHDKDKYYKRKFQREELSERLETRHWLTAAAVVLLFSILQWPRNRAFALVPPSS